jgi:hypothetical protein
MKKARIALTLALTITVCSCTAGPHQLRRSVDDWDQKTYIKQPWINGLMHLIPVIPILNICAFIGDTVVVDAYSFWFRDAWDGKGTGYRHFQYEPTDGAMDSFLFDDTKFMEIK